MSTRCSSSSATATRRSASAPRDACRGHAGRKTFSSGVGHVSCALVTAAGKAGWQMLLLATDEQRPREDRGGGAIRFAAVQQGGVEGVFDETRRFLARLGRTGDPFQRACLGEMA